MRKLPYVLGFLVALIVADLAVGQGLMHLHRQLRTGKSGGEIRWALEQIDTQVLVLGSSRAVGHVDTTQMSAELNVQAINMGENSQG
ncbi:MAG: hypothetical protein ACNA8W_21965, partial [Bradymonadaceae bacterium]